jgi:hypothetical protein
MNAGHAQDIVKNYLEARPEDRHLNMFILIVVALREKLPKAENPEIDSEFLSSYIKAKVKKY